MSLVLNPEVKMRPDGGRAILFSVNSADSAIGSCFRFLYPQQAVILSLFDGQSDLVKVKESVAYLFDLDAQTASEEVDDLLALHVNKEMTIGSLIIDRSSISKNKVRFYNPKEFMIPAEKVDMYDIRCKYPCGLLVLPTMSCFTDCVYCYANREGFQGQGFTLSLFKNLLKEAHECGIETVEFSGGDLFCRKDAFDLIQCTFSADMYPNIPTKYPLSREQIERLERIGLSTIQISIDALDPEIIDRLVAKQPGYGKRILQTINDLGECGIKVRTNTTLTPYNIKDAINLGRYLAQQSHVFRSNFSCYSRSLYRHNDRLFCSPNYIHEFEKAFDQIRKEFPNKKMSFSGSPADPYLGDETRRASAFKKRAFCTANRRNIVVLPDGKVTICEELYLHENFVIGDLKKQTLMEVWNSAKALELAHPNQAQVHNGPCKDCPDFMLCHEGLGRCFRESLKAYGYDRPYWPDPRCPRAPIGNRMA